MSVFEKLIQDFARENTADLLKDCMTSNSANIKKIPLRYRLIALGFASGMSLEELNKKLKAEGCEQLYARNFVEAGLIYAFLNHMTYEEWQGLERKYETVIRDKEKSPYFSGRTVTYRELKAYVAENSDICNEILYTRAVTKRMERELGTLNGAEEKFRRFLRENQENFTIVREKTRYYFCKYLYYYIDQKIETYLESRRTGFGAEQAASDLFVLKSAVKLRRKNLREEELKEMFLDSGISFGNIYDAFNYFYFDYVSSDWMEVLLDYYGGNIEKMDRDSRQELAEALRNYEPQWKSLGDEEVIRRKYAQLEAEEQKLDREYSLAGGRRGYQKNRSGEKSVRNYIQGIWDIDRTTLICYLLFLGKDLEACKAPAITENRLNTILLECGFAMLRREDDFDYFVMEYLHAKDPTDYLMEAVTQYAMQEKNFFLFHMYRNSVSNDEIIKNLIR